MKSTILLLLLCMFVNQTYLKAQENQAEANKDKIGITFSSFGENYVVQPSGVMGLGGLDGDYFFDIGLCYNRPLNKYLSIETGLEYSLQGLNYSYNNYYGGSGEEKYRISLLDIPLALKINFLTYFFVTAGPIIDIDISMHSPISDQSGVGGLFSFGVKYDFKGGISAFAGPYLKGHSLLPVTDFDYHEKLVESGFRLGVSYTLGK